MPAPLGAGFAMHLRRAIGFALMLAVATTAVLPAFAQDNQRRWWQFGRRAGDSNESFNRSVSNLQPIGGEIHLPVGYPTLSNANFQPIRDAIQRYQAIVARGGCRVETER